MMDNELCLEELKKRIYGAFATSSQNDVNFALQILDLILEQETALQGRLLQYVCELWGTVKSSKEVDVTEKISKTEYEKLKRLYGGMVNATLVSYIRLGLLEGWDRIQFYDKLWESINTNVLWDDDVKKAFALYYIAIDRRSPYYNIGTGLKMNGDDYSRIQDEIYEQFREFIFIEALEFSQRTEKASLILNIISRMDNEEKKVVLLSRIIAHYEDKVDKVISKFGNGRS